MKARGEAVRADDNPESLKNAARRLSCPDRAADRPITASKGVLKTTDGMAPIDEVTAAIGRLLTPAAPAKPPRKGAERPKAPGQRPRPALRRPKRQEKGRKAAEIGKKARGGGPAGPGRGPSPRPRARALRLSGESPERPRQIAAGG